MECPFLLPTAGNGKEGMMAKKSGVSGSIRRLVFKRDGYTCKKCGLSGYEYRHKSGSFVYPTNIEGIFLSIDHIIPKSLGGTNDISNLETLCTTCNTKKGVSMEARNG